MPVSPPYPDLFAIIQLIGEAGAHLAEIGASEGAAGNISVALRWPVPETIRLFPIEAPFELPPGIGDTSALAGATVVVTGSGRRLREIARNPRENLAALHIDEDGRARLFTSPERLFTRPTSELVSHLGVHARQIVRTDTNFHAVVHAQPLHMVYLSHIPRYQDTAALNRRLLRWQPETLIMVPEGIGYTPYTTPGTAALMDATLEAMERHRVVLWARHGLIVRSDVSVKKAVDLIEYVEVAARYEYLNMVNGDAAEGIPAEELRLLCKTHGVPQSVF